MVSYAYTVAARLMGAVKSAPRQHAQTPARFSSPMTTTKPNTCHQCWWTFFQLAFIAGQNFICWSMISGAVNCQFTVKYVAGIMQANRMGKVPENADQSCGRTFWMS